jgi:purine-binding chemotaxis protein CheW
MRRDERLTQGLSTMSDPQMTTETAALPLGVADQDVGEAKQFLTFVLDGEEYGVEILRVQEIKGWEGVTRVPHTPHYLLGVTNLRGTVVPVIDLRARFQLPHVEFNSGNVVIVFRVAFGRVEKTVGIVVDGVSEVYDFLPGDIRPPPQVKANLDPSLIAGLGTAGDKMVLLLDIERLVASSIDPAAATRSH